MIDSRSARGWVLPSLPGHFCGYSWATSYTHTNTHTHVFTARSHWQKAFPCCAPTARWWGWTRHPPADKNVHLTHWLFTSPYFSLPVVTSEKDSFTQTSTRTSPARWPGYSCTTLHVQHFPLDNRCWRDTRDRQSPFNTVRDLSRLINIAGEWGTLWRTKPVSSCYSLVCFIHHCWTDFFPESNLEKKKTTTFLQTKESLFNQTSNLEIIFQNVLT